MASLISKLTDLFKKRDLDLSGVNVSALTTPEDHVLYGGEEFHFASSNVDHMVFYHDESRLVVTFKHGGEYEYIGITPNQIREFMRSSSPGRWVWNFLRGGGVAYNRLRDAYIPKREQKPTVIRTQPKQPRFRQ